MAGVFDISTYEQLGGAKAAIDPNVLAAANRAKRIALLGEDAVLKMEAAAARFGTPGATVPPPRPMFAAGGRMAAPELAAARAGSAMPMRGVVPPVAPAVANAGAVTRMGKIRSLLTGKGSVAGLTLTGGLAAIDNFDTLLPMVDRWKKRSDEIGEALKTYDPYAPIAPGEPRPTELSPIEQVNAMYAPRPAPRVAAPVAPATKVEAPGIGAKAPVSGWVTDPAERKIANSVIESAAIPPSGTGYIRGEKGKIWRFVNASETPERAAEGAAAREREMIQNMPSTGFASIDAAMKATLREFPSIRAARERKSARADIVAQTALAKALEDVNKPSKVDIAEPALGTNEPGLVTVVSADGKVVTHPKGLKPIPEGYTRESVLADAIARRALLVGKNKNTKGVEKQIAVLEARLQEYGLKLPPLK